MTGKRFVMYGNTVYEMIDNNKVELLPTDCFCLLNELNNENEQLKENCNNYTWYKEYKRLLNENEQLRKENQKLESLWEDKCIREYTKIVGEYALQEMHDKKYGDKE